MYVFRHDHANDDITLFCHSIGVIDRGRTGMIDLCIHLDRNMLGMMLFFFGLPTMVFIMVMIAKCIAR